MHIDIEIDEGSGFCNGVIRAVEKAEMQLKESGTLYSLGAIVHNNSELERLEKIGLEVIDTTRMKSLSDTTVLIRAHGEPPATYKLAEKNNISLIDCTCPVVLKLQDRIRETYNKVGGQIVIFGKKGHAEVIGLEGQTNNTAIVVESVKDLEMVDYTKSIYLFSQTTKSVEEFHAIVKAIEANRQIVEEVKDEKNVFEYHDTICRNVAKRVKRIQDFAKGNDVVIFVGGKKSSNAKVLYNHCLEVNSSTVFVSSAEDVTEELLNKCRAVDRVGICGATSTPKWLMGQIKLKVESI